VINLDLGTNCKLNRFFKSIVFITSIVARFTVESTQGADLNQDQNSKIAFQFLNICELRHKMNENPHLKEGHEYMITNGLELDGGFNQRDAAGGGGLVRLRGGLWPGCLDAARQGRAGFPEFRAALDSPAAPGDNRLEGTLFRG
jgi:hypothetical protein